MPWLRGIYNTILAPETRASCACRPPMARAAGSSNDQGQKCPCPLWRPNHAARLWSRVIPGPGRKRLAAHAAHLWPAQRAAQTTKGRNALAPYGARTTPRAYGAGSFLALAENRWRRMPLIYGPRSGQLKRSRAEMPLPLIAPEPRCAPMEQGHSWPWQKTAGGACRPPMARAAGKLKRPRAEMPLPLIAPEPRRAPMEQGHSWPWQKTAGGACRPPMARAAGSSNDQGQKCPCLEIGSSCGGEEGAAQVGFAFNGLRAVAGRVHEVA